MVKDVGDGEIVAEGGDDEGDGGEEHGSEYNHAGAASGFAQAFPVGLALKEEGDKANSERIDAQRQCEEQGKTTNLRHVGEPQCIFSETEGTGNHKPKRRGPRRLGISKGSLPRFEGNPKRDGRTAAARVFAARRPGLGRQTASRNGRYALCWR